MDYFGRVVTSSNNDPISIQLTTTGSQYTPRFDAGTSQWSKGGVFNLTEATFIGEPNSEVTLILQSSFIDESLELVETNYNLNIPIAFRSCESGEEFTSDGQCLECSSGSYLIEPATSPTNCLTCPINAECFGGNRITPKPGYWRPSDTSL